MRGLHCTITKRKTTTTLTRTHTMDPQDSKVEAAPIVSPRSLAPSSSTAPIIVPPIIGIPSQARGRCLGSESPQPDASPIARVPELSDDAYYRHLYRSVEEDWGSESAEALVTLARRIRADPDHLDRNSDAWRDLDRACKRYLARQKEEAYFARLREQCQQKRQELAELRSDLDARREQHKQRGKRKRTLSLSPRAFVKSMGLLSSRSRSGSLGRPATARERETPKSPAVGRARLSRSRSSGILPRLPRASKADGKRKIGGE